MNRFGFSASVLDSVAAVLRGEDNESLQMAKIIENYILYEKFDKEHVGSSKNYHIHSINPEEGQYSLTHKETGKKTSINVSDNYPMNKTSHVKKDIKGKVPGSDHHSIAKKINSHLQSDSGTGDVRKSLRKQGVKRSDPMESIESLEIAKLIEDYQLNEYFDKEHVGSSKNYHIHSTNPEEGEYSLTHKKTGKKTSVNVSDNYPMNKTSHVKKNIAGKVPGSDHHSIAKKINSHLQGDTGTGDVRKSLRKQGVKRSDPMESFEKKKLIILEAMEMHLKPHGTAGTHYKVHAVGKKLAAHGGVKVGERLSDTEVDDARDSGIRVRHVKEGNEEEVDEGAMKRLATQAAERERLGPTKVKGSGLEGFKKRDSRVGSTKFGGTKSFAQTGRVPMVREDNVTEKKHLDPVDHKALKGSHAQRKDKDIDNDGDVDSSDSYLHNRRKTVKKAINKEAHEMKVKKMGKDAMGAEKVEMSQGCPTVSEGMGDEKVRSSAQAAQLAKHYYMKAKQAQQSGSIETASKMMSAAKKFYRASERDSAQEKGGKQVAAAESSEDIGIGQFYFNELEVQEIEAAEDVNLDEARKGGGAKVGETERSGLRVSKTSKEGPEHVVMQLRKVGSMGNRHPGVEFKDGKKSKVDTNHARAALSRYNSAKPAEREEIQKHLAHSHDALKHVAKGGDLKSSPGASKSKGIAGIDMTQMKRHGVQSKSGHYN